MNQEISFQGAILDCVARAAEVSTTNLMRALRQQFRAMIPLPVIQADCEHLRQAGKLEVRVKGKGRYYRLVGAA